MQALRIEATEQAAAATAGTAAVEMELLRRQAAQRRDAAIQALAEEATEQKATAATAAVTETAASHVGSCPTTPPQPALVALKRQNTELRRRLASELGKRREKELDELDMCDTGPRREKELDNPDLHDAGSRGRNGPCIAMPME